MKERLVYLYKKPRNGRKWKIFLSTSLDGEEYYKHRLLRTTKDVREALMFARAVARHEKLLLVMAPQTTRRFLRLLQDRRYLDD